MTRTVRDASLETRTARQRLKRSGKPYYRAIDPGLHLGYRKGEAGGRWVARWYAGGQRYKVQTIDGVADDHASADGELVLSYAQAQAAARELFAKDRRDPLGRDLTVRKACEAYVEFLRAERKTARDAEGRLEKHVYPKLGDRSVSELATNEIEKCKWAMIRQDPKDPEAERRSKDSANRVLSMLKAALNRVFNEGQVASDVAWRRVKPFKDVSRAREVHLDRRQSQRLMNASTGALRRLITVALLTGARAPHELASLRVRDFRADLHTLSIPGGKTGAREITLTAEAVRYLSEVTAERDPDDLLLPKDDGKPWGYNQQLRPMREAVARAKLPKGCTMYSLRHTHASQCILAGMNLKMLAENMGTSIRMLE